MKVGVAQDTVREYKSREVAQSPIYVIVHSLLEVSFCTQPFPTPGGGLWSLGFLTLLITCEGKGMKGREGAGNGNGGREEREKKGRGAACPNNKKSLPHPCPVSINLAARIKCYRRHGP